MSKALNDAQPPRGKRLLVLCLGTLGVVYGDIATSPLYAIRECFHGEYGIEPRPENVLGVLSLMFWALVIIVVSSTWFLSCSRITTAKVGSSR